MLKRETDQIFLDKIREKRDKKMAKEKKMHQENEEVHEIAKREIHKIVETKQKQSVLNLDSESEDDITVITKKIVWLTLDPPVTNAEKFALLEELIQPEEKRIEMLADRYSNMTYVDSKVAELAKGNYLTPQLQSAIVGFMQQSTNFSDLSAKECRERWLKGYKEKKSGALKYLEMAKAAQSGTSDDF